jgi:anti-anti-sigma factor
MDPDEPTLRAAVGYDPDGTPVVTLDGELDLSTAAIAEQAFAQLPPPDASDAPDAAVEVVVDMADLTFMDSSGLTVLVLAVNQGYAVRLRRPTSIVRELIATTGLSETLPIES